MQLPLPSLDAEHFELVLRPYRRALQILRLALEFFLDDYDRANLVAVEERVKSYASAVRKELSNGIRITDQQDLVGLRIVTATLADIEVVLRFFTRKVDGKDLRILSDDTIHRRPGYRARHLVVEVPPHYSRSPFEIPVEVQLRTTLQHSFAVLSREWFYRCRQASPKEFERRLQAVSDRLATLDKEIAAIYREFVIDSTVSDDLSPLTPAAYQKIVLARFAGEEVPIGDAVDTVRLLSSLGVRTCGAARDFFYNPILEQFLERIQSADPSIHAWVPIIREMRGTSSVYIMFAPRLEALAGIFQGTPLEDAFHPPPGAAG